MDFFDHFPLWRVSSQNTEEDSYYYEYPYYEDVDDKPSQPDGVTTSEKVEVV